MFSNAFARFTSSTIRTLALAIALCGLIASSAFAQGSVTRVSGTVKDPQGAAITGATVTLTDSATKAVKTATTNDDGAFAFNDLRPGVYTVDVEAAGFKKTTVPDLAVNVDQTSTVNIDMEVGGVGETVTVTASDAQAVVHTENAELKNTVLERQIQDLPLNGRNPLTLAGLQAGVNSSGSGTRTASVNGLRGTFTNLTWDGININDNFIRTDSFFGVAAPSVASVSEFTLTTQNASAADGLGVAQLKLVTPRGTGEFHGQLFEFHRNDALDANTFFNNAAGRFVATDLAVIAGRAQVGDERLPRPVLLQNQFGFNIGGPMRIPRFGEGGDSWYGKDKLFFFFFYEGTRTKQEASVTRTFLRADARNGIFRYRATCGVTGQPACPAGITNGSIQTINLLALPGVAGRPIDPTTSELARRAPLPNDPTTGDLFNANVANSGTLSNTGTFRFNSPLGSTSDLWGFRVDYDVNSRNRIEAIFNRFTFLFPNSGGEPFPGAPGDGQDSIRPRGSFAWNWTPTNSISNEARFGFNFYNVQFFTNEPFNRGNQIVLPLVTDSEDNFLPQGRDVKTWELIDNASWTKGNHTLRFGGNFRDNYIRPYNDAGTLPSFNIGFSGTAGNANPLSTGLFPGGIGTADFNTATSVLGILLGPVSSAAQTFNAATRTEGYVPGATQRQDFRYFGLAGYAQDTWRFRTNLSLNLGVRYEFISVPSERLGLVLLPTNREMSVLRENAVLDFASGGDRRGFFNNDTNNFAPHFSFAWDPWSDGKTSVRGGYSISYVIDNNITTVLNAIRGNPGLVGTTVTITDTRLAGRTGSSVPTIPVPAFQVPRTVAQNLTDFGFASAFFTFEPDFKTPYVQQWNFGIEREIFADTALEVRYVGNRGTKLTRGIDYNQLKVGQNAAFLEDVRRGFNNIALCGATTSNNPNPTAAQCPGRTALSYIPLLGAGLGLNGFLQDASVRNLFRTGQAGALAEFYAGANRPFFFGAGVSTIPITDFLPNPNTFIADAYINGANSWYHGLQTEVRRRFSDGLYFQANYTYSRAMTDFEGSQSNFAGLMDLGFGTSIEKQRSFNDVTHVFKANGVYELPFGPGKRWANWGGVAGKILGGWSLNGLMRWQSGEPIAIVSARSTLNRAGRSGLNTVNSTLSVQQLQDRTGLFFDATGRPVLFDPALISAVRANANAPEPGGNQFLTNPTAGNVGSLQLTPVSGPSVFFLDMSMIKRTNITERVNIEFRAEAFNLLNHTAFDVSQTQNINAAGFGQITSTFAPRVMQFGLKLNF